jgi:hypothetical protein
MACFNALVVLVLREYLLYASMCELAALGEAFRKIKILLRFFSL